MSPSHGVQSFRNRLLQRGLLSSRVHRYLQEPAPARAPHRGTASFRHPPPPAWGPFHRLQVDNCSTIDLHGMQGSNVPHHGLHHELKGKTLYSGVLSASSPSFFTDLCVCRVVSFTSSHSSLSPAVSPQVFFFLPLLNYVIPEALPSSLFGLALASGGSVLEPAGTGFIRHGGCFLQLLTEGTPIDPCYQNLALQTQNTWDKLEFTSHIPKFLF